MTRAGVGGATLFYATLPGPIKTALAGPLVGPDSNLNQGQTHTLRGLWDAVVPGTWEGVVEDRLENGDPAPGADDAKVQEWMEQISGEFPWPLNWLTDTFMALWADDLDLWADVVHGIPFDGQPKFWELPLDPTIIGRGRQRKIILMQALFGAAIDAQYLVGITLSKVAFYCDFWYEANEPGTRVGREYIGWPPPPRMDALPGLHLQPCPRRPR